MNKKVMFYGTRNPSKNTDKVYTSLNKYRLFLSFFNIFHIFRNLALGQGGSLCSTVLRRTGAGTVECFVVGHMVLGKEVDFQWFRNALGLCKPLSLCVSNQWSGFLLDSNDILSHFALQPRNRLQCIFFLFTSLLLEINTAFGKTFVSSLTMPSHSFTACPMCQGSICPQLPFVCVYVWCLCWTPGDSVSENSG